MDAEQGEQFLSCMEYMYRTILTNDFGWAHLPFSTMEDNTVFLLFTAMLKNFYQYLLAKVSEIFPGVDMKSRLKLLSSPSLLSRRNGSVSPDNGL